MDTTALTIASCAKLLRSREISSREVTQQYLETIEQENPTLNAFLSLEAEGALRVADEVDAAILRNETIHPLSGVPLALKDNLLVKEHVTTAASKILAEYRASYSATVVEKLQRARAVILGKTNLDEFAMGASTENSAFGTTKNPHDLERVPGGSSGGSAAAVAGGLALASLGSDTGGSVRQPAAFCGVVGFKPTYGTVSRFGLIAMASSLDQIGPITKTVEDAEILFETIAGRDPFDATSVEYQYERMKNTMKPFTIGVPKECMGDGLSQEVRQGITRALDMFKSFGYTVREISLPHMPLALAAYYIIMPAEVSTNLARLDGVRYLGVRAVEDTVEKLNDLYIKTRGIGFGREAKRRILLGTFVLSAGYYDAYYAQAQKVRRLVANDFENAFNTSSGGVDVIFAPTTPTTAFNIGEKTDNPLAMYLSDIFTVPVNLAGLPAISIPVKRYTVGGGELPVGFQLIGKKFREADIFALGKQYESVAI